MDRAWKVLIGTGIASLVAALDFTIVNTSLASIQHDINISISQLQWIMAGFGLLFSTMMVTMGRLGDLKGRRKVLYINIIGFGLTSLGAGMAQTPLFLIAMRILQGLFAAGIFPCGMALTAVAFPQNLQGRALSLYSTIFGIGLAFGPVLGGLLITLLNWRWIFFINIPMLLVSLVICLSAVEESKQLNAEAIDWPGVITLILFLGPLIFAISQGGYYGWQSSIILISFLISLIALILFIIIEYRTAAPLIPIQLFLNSGFLLGMLAYFDGISLNWPIMFIMPLYLHQVLGLTTGHAGLLLFPLTMMTVIAPLIAGHYYDKSRRAPTIIIHTLFLCSIISLTLFTQFGAHGPIWLIIPAFILFGSAWGIANGIGLPLALSKMTDTENSGLISGALATVMSLLGTIALTANVSLFDYSKQQHNFLYGLHLACAALLIVSVIFWLCTLTIQLSARKK